jgi:hypothetical protein
MKKLIVILIVIFLDKNVSIAQSIDFSGSKVDINKICNDLGFSNDKEAIEVFDKICEAAAIKNNFKLVECNGINGCKSNVKNGVAYILYDNNFLKSIKSNNALGFTEKKINTKNAKNEEWTSITILAHELGHHVQQHFGEDVQKFLGNYEIELQADEYAGNILCILGASLQEGKQAYYSSVIPEEKTIDHPDKASRIKRFEEGYKKRSGLLNKTRTVINSPSELILGSWMEEKGVISTFYKNGLLQITNKGNIDEFYWEIDNEILKLKKSNNQNTQLADEYIIKAVNPYTLTITSKNKPDGSMTLQRTSSSASATANNYLSENWNSTIYVDAMSWTTRKIGGIWDVNVPVVNKNDFPIDFVRVKVEYVKDSDFASGDIYKTEYVDFVNILPNSKKIIKAPNSDRGTKIRTSIVTVRSSKININK